MGCNCNKGSAAKSAPKSYTVKLADGGTKSYRSEVEAAAAAKRLGGTCQNCR